MAFSTCACTWLSYPGSLHVDEVLCKVIYCCSWSAAALMDLMTTVALGWWIGRAAWREPVTRERVAWWINVDVSCPWHATFRNDCCGCPY
jgi:hypothetical protein